MYPLFHLIANLVRSKSFGSYDYDPKTDKQMTLVGCLLFPSLSFAAVPGMTYDTSDANTPVALEGGG